jgi:hypothetical protein
MALIKKSQPSTTIKNGFVMCRHFELIKMVSSK